MSELILFSSPGTVPTNYSELKVVEFEMKRMVHQYFRQSNDVPITTTRRTSSEKNFLENIHLITLRLVAYDWVRLKTGK